MGNRNSIREMKLPIFAFLAFIIYSIFIGSGLRIDYFVDASSNNIKSTSKNKNKTTERGLEKEWVRIIAKDLKCKEEEIEVILFNKTRVDILTDEIAVEVDWAEKFYEGYGQAKYYGIITDRQPVLILLEDEESDVKYIERALILCSDIKLWVYNIRYKKWEVLGKR